MKQASYKDHPVWNSVKRFITVTNDRVVLESFGKKYLKLILKLTPYILTATGAKLQIDK